MNNKLHVLALFACLSFALVGCATRADGDGDGDGETGTAETHSDGDTTTGDGDTTTGDGDGDATTGDGDGDTGLYPLPGGCTSDGECVSGSCYLLPFLGGYCGECNEDVDCPDGGCTAPSPFQGEGPVCNMGEAGGGCETDDACMEGLSCANVFDLLGLLQITTCGECITDADCTDQICAPLVVFKNYAGQNTCIDVNTLPQHSFCDLDGNGDEACESAICSTIDIQGMAELGACGECTTDDDCMSGTCMAGEFVFDNGTILGSTCI